MNNFSVYYLPSQWRALGEAQYRQSVCVVIDVIRATTTIAAALANGARGVRPVASVAEAEALKRDNPTHLLAGERKGMAVPGFDLGNSPRALTEDLVRGREIILTTTNGTQALAACRRARAVITCGLVNLGATAQMLRSLGGPWTILCAGFEGSFGLDDAIVAGALAEELGEASPFASLFDSVRSDLGTTLQSSQAGHELRKIGLQDDVLYCAMRDVFPVVPMLGSDGVLRDANQGRR